ncbi:hypothetical protein KR044_005525 [Drosophila immigrans]|nr:hypothetical protein KR044_005525 [Drosophila immigrans]
MDSFIMSRIDDHEIDCYHQYIAQTNYRCEQPEDGAHVMMFEPHGRVDRPHDTYNPVGVSTYSNGPQSFGELGQRSPPPAASRQRAPTRTRNNNARNGLGSTQEPCEPCAPRADCGDYYNSMPELPRLPQQLQQRRPMRNRLFF